MSEPQQQEDEVIPTCEDCGKIILFGADGEDDVASGDYICLDCGALLCLTCYNAHEEEHGDLFDDNDDGDYVP